MARRHRRRPPGHERPRAPRAARCPLRGGPAPVAYHGRRPAATRDGLGRLPRVVRRCRNAAGPLDRRPDRPEGEGAVALPPGEFGLDPIALVGAPRCARQRTAPAGHAERRGRGAAVAARSVTNPVPR